MIYGKPELGAEAKCDVCDQKGGAMVFGLVLSLVLGFLMGITIGVYVI